MDSEDSDADLSLRWVHTHSVGFIMSWLTYLRIFHIVKQNSAKRIRALIQKFKVTVHENGKPTASSFKFLPISLYICLIDSPQYQNNSVDISI